jgi:hypothetical protein
MEYSRCTLYDDIWSTPDVNSGVNNMPSRLGEVERGLERIREQERAKKTSVEQWRMGDHLCKKKEERGIKRKSKGVDR